MNGFIDNYLKDLTKILDEALNFAFSNNLINENKEIFDYLKDFNNRLKSEQVDIMKCDFKTIRRKVNKIIHPDLNPKFKTEANKIVAKINVNIDNILEFQKTMIQKQIESYNWSNKSNQRKYEFKKDFGTQKSDKEKYKTYYSGDLEKEDLYIYGYQTVGDQIKELWDYIINKVPRDLNDYKKIKKAYEKLIEKLKDKIENKEAIIKDLELNIKSLHEELKEKLKNVNLVFEQEKKTLKDEHNKIIDNYEEQNQILENIKNPLKPHIDKIASERCKIMEKIYLDYGQIRKMVASNPVLLKSIYPGTKGTYTDLLKTYENELNKYPNAQVIYDKTANDVYMQNRDYVREHKKIEHLETKAREVYDKMMPYFDNPEVVKIGIKNEIQNSYDKKIKALESRKRLIEKKDDKLNIKLERIEAEYAKFLLTYEASYGSVQKKGGSR